MISLPIISIVCCLAYIFYIIFRYGVPVSISETYYMLPTKWDWLFAAWTVMTTVPLGIYWFTIAPDNLKWIPVTVAIAMLMIGVACCYKSGPKKEEGYDPQIACGNTGNITDIAMFVSGMAKYSTEKASDTKSFWDKIKEILAKFKPSEFFKYGPARLIHYANSLIAIILTTVYICTVYGKAAIAGTIVMYAAFIVIGAKVNGVYNPDYSADVDNKAWIFFMEVICLVNLFTWIWM